MTERNRKTLQFSSLSRKKILADFKGGHLTSDGGALLLREVNRRSGLIDALAECITDPREPAKIKHDAKTMLAHRVYGIALGYEDGNDHQTLRNEPMMPLLAEADPGGATCVSCSPQRSQTAGASRLRLLKVCRRIVLSAYRKAVYITAGGGT